MEMSGDTLRLPDGRRIAVDAKGYLCDPRDWSREVAEVMAAADGIELTSDHWTVLEVFREHFARFDVEAPMRVLVRQTRARLGEQKGTSRYLYRLFPDGPGTQACRYAGLPRPVSCI
jgi:tRNA 2-thiouridine synthesizing protein E